VNTHASGLPALSCPTFWHRRPDRGEEEEEEVDEETVEAEVETGEGAAVADHELDSDVRGRL